MRFKRILWGIAVLSATLLVATGAHAQNVEYYVLDGFGGVHAGGGAPVIAPASPYFGFDVARDIMYAPGITGQGYIVLDGWGGVHAGGAIGSIAPGPPYFGFDIAKGITYRNIPPRVGANAIGNLGNQSVTSSSYVSIISATMNAPDDGFVVASCNMSMGNNAGSIVVGRIAIGRDNLVAFGGVEAEVGFPSATGGNFSWTSPARIQTISVTPGLHTFHCLARRQSGTAAVLYFDPAISLIFIDQANNGATIPETNGYAGPDGSVGGQ